MGRRRGKYMSVHFSDGEYEVIKEKAERAGLPKSVYLRLAGLGKEYPENLGKDLPALIHELRRTGSGIDRLLRIAEAGGSPEAQELRAVLADVRAAEKRVFDIFTD